MICNQNGQLVGIITSNAKHSDGSIIPEINFAVPLSFFRELLTPPTRKKTLFLDSELTSVFEEETKKDQLLKMLWSLQPVEMEGNNDRQQDQHQARGENFYNFFNKFLESKL